MAYTKTSTPIVYYGGKTAILNHILPLIPEHEVYTEVFFGGGAVFFAKKPAKNETINDRLDVVVNFYRVLRDRRLFIQLQQRILSTTYSRFDLQEAREIIKANNKGTISDQVGFAWAFWMSMICCFEKKLGSGFSYSNSQSVSKPKVLTHKKARFNYHLQKRIENAYIENCDALKILNSRNVKKAFHYQDPPYPGADQGHYSGYTWDDFEKLLKWNQDECKGKFLLSNYNSPLLDEYIERNGWIKTEITHRLKAPRKSGTTKTEVLVRNYENVCNTLPLFN